MRSSVVFVLAGLLAIASVIACTGSITGDGADHSMISSRVTDACHEIISVCDATGQDCLAKTAFCGPLTDALAPVFTAESSCKSGCSDTSCLKDCKLVRTMAVTSIFATRDLGHDSTVGDGLNACNELQQTCTSSGDGCNATEFFCVAARPVADACSMELDTCKQDCGTDRACKRACRQAYRQCERGGGTSGSGTTPDAGTTAPDAPTTTTPDAPTTSAPTYTYTNDIKPVTTGYCAGCHSGSNPPQNYSTDSYAGLLGGGSDNTPNVIPGDASSKFVVYVKNNHKNVLNIYPGFDQIAYDWVVVDNAAQ